MTSKALADPARLRLLSIVASGEGQDAERGEGHCRGEVEQRGAAESDDAACELLQVGAQMRVRRG